MASPALILVKLTKCEQHHVSVKIDQLMSLAQHVSNVSTSILRSLRLIC